MSDGPDAAATGAGYAVTHCGQIVVLALLLPLAGSLVVLARESSSAVMVPAVYLAGTVVFGLVCLLERGAGKSVSLGAATIMSSAILLYGVLIWFDLPYVFASTLILGAGFLVLGGRSWRLMLLLWIAAEALGYGFF